jgi:hypothetical protein
MSKSFQKWQNKLRDMQKNYFNTPRNFARRKKITLQLHETSWLAKKLLCTLTKLREVEKNHFDMPRNKSDALVT